MKKTIICISFILMMGANALVGSMIHCKVEDALMSHLGKG